MMPSLTHDVRPDGDGKSQILSLREKELLSLIEICKLIGSVIVRDELLNTIIKVVRDLLDAEGASIIILSEDKKELLFCVVTGEKSDILKKIRLKYGEGIAGNVIAQCIPVIVNDAQNDPRFCSRIDDESEFKTRNILCVPMKAGNKIIGALEVVNKRNNKDFDFYDSKICEAMASQPGVAIDRADLIEENLKSAKLATIGQTVAGLAHCVKNILNGLEGGQYIVKRGLEKNDEAKINRGWNMVEKNIKRISTMVFDMLHYVKDRKPEYAEVDPNQTIEEVKDLFLVQAEKAGVRIETKMDKNLNKAMIDPKGLYRCLVNLVRNAIDACTELDNEGVVTLESRLDSDDHFIISVNDNGIGMDEQILKNLFTKFFSTKGSKGTGLGLPVTYKIIQEHNGSINVDSRSGEGTTFSISLPLLQP